MNNPTTPPKYETSLTTSLGGHMFVRLVPLQYSDADEARKKLQALLKKVLSEPGAKAAFDRLVEAHCDPLILECLLTDPVMPDQPVDTAESRKANRNNAKELLRSLEKTQKLTALFRKSAEPMVYLEDALKKAIVRVRPWAELPRPRLLYTRRQDQQFRLLEYIYRSTGEWRLEDAATLLSALYTVHNIAGEHPSEESLRYLVKRFTTNSACWQKARLKASQTR